MIEAFRFEGEAEGPHILFFGAAHGREYPGTVALRRLINALNWQDLSLNAGKVTIVPVCNPRAFLADQRQIDENLNRLYTGHHNTPKTYEQQLANELVPLLDEADVLIDLHTTRVRGFTYTFQDYENPAMDALMPFLPVDYVVHDWPKMFAADNSDDVSADSYMGQLGKAGTCFECGQTDNPATIETAYAAVLNVLKGYGLIAGEAKRYNATRVYGQKIYRRLDENDYPASDFSNFEAVTKGQPIIKRADGTVETAPADGYVFLTNPAADVGAELMYFGVRHD